MLIDFPRTSTTQSESPITNPLHPAQTQRSRGESLQTPDDKYLRQRTVTPSLYDLRRLKKAYHLDKTSHERCARAEPFVRFSENGARWASWVDKR